MPISGNGAFGLSPDFRAHGGRTNSRVVPPSSSGEAFEWRCLRRNQLSAIMPASGGWFRGRAVAELASGLQLARSTHMMFGVCL